MNKTDSINNYEQARDSANAIRSQVVMEERTHRAQTGYVIAVCALVATGFWNVYEAIRPAMSIYNNVIIAIVAAGIAVGVCVLAPYKAGQLLVKGRTEKSATHCVCSFALVSMCTLILAFISFMRIFEGKSIGFVANKLSVAESMMASDVFLPLILTLAMAICFIAEFARGYMKYYGRV